MHPNAYGLNNAQREQVVKMAKSRCFYEAKIANTFDISIVAVRDICAKMGSFVPNKVENGKHVDGYDL